MTRQDTEAQHNRNIHNGTVPNSWLSVCKKCIYHRTGFNCNDLIIASFSLVRKIGIQKLTDIINEYMVHKHVASVTVVNVNLPSWLFIDTWSQRANCWYVADNNATRSNRNCSWVVGIDFFGIYKSSGVFSHQRGLYSVVTMMPPNITH